VEAFRKSAALLVARNIEACAWVAMFAAWPPIRLAPFARTAAAHVCLRLFRRLPQPPLAEPLHHRVGMFALELLERRDQLVPLLRAERRRLSLEDDGPVSEAWWHGA
jgi:hypothetical protein